MHSDYQVLRTFADSWGLAYMFAVFVIVVCSTLRPGGKVLSNDAAQVPFREKEDITDV